MNKPARRQAREQLTPYAEAWRQRAHREAYTAAVWRCYVRSRIPEISNLLIERYGTKKVVLFGSFARDEAIPGSDIDLLVAELPMELIIDATVAAERIVPDVSVDLVPLECARPEVLARIQTEGILLHDR